MAERLKYNDMTESLPSILNIKKLYEETVGYKVSSVITNERAKSFLNKKLKTSSAYRKSYIKVLLHLYSLLTKYLKDLNARNRVDLLELSEYLDPSVIKDIHKYNNYYLEDEDFIYIYEKLLFLIDIVQFSIYSFNEEILIQKTDMFFKEDLLTGR